MWSTGGVKSKTMLVTVVGGDYDRLYSVVGPRLLEWCERNGVILAKHGHKLDERRNWSWNKLYAVYGIMQQHDVNNIICCDADCVPVNMDTGVPGPSLIHRLWVSSDYNGPCCGFFVIPNIEPMRDLIRTWITLGPLENPLQFDNRDTWEQATFKAMLKLSPNIRDHVAEIGTVEVSNPSTRGLSRLPTFHHLWAHNGLDRTINEARALIEDPAGFLKKAGVMA